MEDHTLLKIDNIPTSNKLNMTLEVERLCAGVYYATIGVNIKSGTAYVTLDIQNAAALQMRMDGMRFHGAILSASFQQIPDWYKFPMDYIVEREKKRQEALLSMRQSSLENEEDDGGPILESNEEPAHSSSLS